MMHLARRLDRLKPLKIVLGPFVTNPSTHSISIFLYSARFLFLNVSDVLLILVG